MDLTPWVNDKFKVQFYKSYELGRVVGPSGFTERACGISVAAAELTHAVNMEDNELHEVLINFLDQLEDNLVEAVEELFDSPNYDKVFEDAPFDHNALTLKNFYPVVNVTIETTDGDDVIVEFVMNERQVSAGNHARFIAILTENETQPYQVEREK